MTKEKGEEVNMPIEFGLAGGFRDYLPGDMIPRQAMLDTIRKVFETFGFVPLDTPGIEQEQVLTGGDPNFKMQIFRAGLRNSSEGLALRFDLTVPLARVVASYRSEIGRPFKRYQTGKVWRGEKPQAGRYREFVQFDADIVGTKSMQADAEIVAIIYETMVALGFERFLIRVNNRKILNGLADYAGFPAERTADVLRIIDKLDKINWEGVASELSEAAVGLSPDAVSAVKRFLDLRATGHDELLQAVEALMKASGTAREGVAELREVLSHVRALGVPDDKWVFDLSVARGLGYYTGPVFETVLTDLPGIGSVFSGGRYDDLVARFDPNATVPAVGASVGVDRLFAAMEKLGLVGRQKTVTKVVILNFDAASALSGEAIATNLRRAGIPTEVYFGNEATLKGQLTYAVKQGVPVAIIIGATEQEAGTAQVKDLGARRQETVPQAEVVKAVSRLLG